MLAAFALMVRPLARAFLVPGSSAPTAMPTATASSAAIASEARTRHDEVELSPGDVVTGAVGSVLVSPAASSSRRRRVCLGPSRSA